jgi:hypothetical protein
MRFICVLVALAALAAAQNSTQNGPTTVVGDVPTPDPDAIVDRPALDGYAYEFIFHIISWQRFQIY